MRPSLPLAAAMLALPALPAAAALPPNYQRLAELRAVLALPEVASLGGTMQPVERIEHAGPDLYRVTAGRCRLDVRIVDLPTPRNMAGPRRFAARPGRPACGR